MQKLKAKNLNAAKAIYNELKTKKTISQLTFDNIYIEETGARRHGSFVHLIETTINFLMDHGIMTMHSINGLTIYIATQKCFRTKSFSNATKHYITKKILIHY